MAVKVLEVGINPEEAIKSLKEQTGKYPLVSFLLYSEEDREFAEFVKDKGDWLHALTGDDLYVGVFANPEQWDNSWWNFWTEKLGQEYISKLKKDIDNGLIFPNHSYDLAAKLGIDKGTLPGIFIAEDLDKNEFMYIPIFQHGSESDYKQFFNDVISCVQKANNYAEGQRLVELKGAWHPFFSLKWKVHSGYENSVRTILEEGKLLKEVAETLAAIITPFVDIFTSIISKVAPIPTPH